MKGVIFMSESKLFPKFQIVKYSYNPDIMPIVYHLIINDKYEGCYTSKSDLLERLSLLIVSEVSGL